MMDSRVASVMLLCMYSQQHVTLFTCSSILALMTFVIRAVQTPKCIVWCDVDCTLFTFCCQLVTLWIFKGRFYFVNITIARSGSIICMCNFILNKKTFRWFIHNLYFRNLHAACKYHHLQLAPTNPQWARVVGYGLFSFCVIHKEGLCNSGNINRLMIHTYIPLTLDLRKGSRGISNIPPRHLSFTKIS
jgi:hypothetical protein